jgi:hypothetical protein
MGRVRRRSAQASPPLCREAGLATLVGHCHDLALSIQLKADTEERGQIIDVRKCPEVRTWLASRSTRDLTPPLWYGVFIFAWVILDLNQAIPHQAPLAGEDDLMEKVVTGFDLSGVSSIGPGQKMPPGPGPKRRWGGAAIGVVVCP